MNEFIRKVQLTEYDIFKEFDRICKKYDIKYFLGQGTLLGAVKYKKFIPWDDDIDLLISYDELERLIEVFEKETTEEYIVANYKTEKYFPLSWTKIRAKNTLSRPKRYKELPINWGICIDLFPIYPLSNSKILRKLEVVNIKIASKMMMAGMTQFEENHGVLVRLLEKIPICVRHFCMNFATKILTSHKNDSEYVWLPCRGGKVVKRSLLYGEEKRLVFEDNEYPAPSEYHEYLILNYGDYTKPLPDDQKKGHELNLGDIEWKL